jgi:ATP-dependent DNA helicase DinG
MKVYSDDNWVFNEVPAYGSSSKKLEFKPIDISPFSEELLFKFGRKVVLMSATILDGDAFCESLGIKKSDTQFVSIPSPFPVENRPVYYFPVGKMSAKSINETLPKLTEAVKSILDQHKNEKGIIHCHTFKIANHLKNTIRSKRLLIHDSSNRDQILRKHISEKGNTVLLSPSMTEGVDLKDDASRFQVICKVPYPYLGDKLVKKRMYKWKWWYPLQTTKKIVQSVGRSIRNEDDFAVTYILDQDWDRFYSSNSSLFPKTFKEALKE